MSDLKNFLKEAKTNLQDLEELLQRARSLDHGQIDETVLNRDEVQRYFEEILRIIEKLPENLKLGESLIWREEVKKLHKQMEDVYNRVAESIGRVEVAWEKNLQKLLEELETLSHPINHAMQQQGQGNSDIGQIHGLLRQGKSHFEDKDFEGCIQKLTEALKVDPGNSEATSLISEAKKKWEDQRLEEELVTHIEHLKKEAMDHFDREEFEKCIGMFKFLCELEPQNGVLRHYLELSRLKVQEAEDAASGNIKVRDSIARPAAVGDENQEAKPSGPVPETSVEQSVYESGPSPVQGVAQQDRSVEPDLLEASLVTRPETIWEAQEPVEDRTLTGEASILGRISGKRLTLGLLAAAVLLSAVLGMWWNMNSVLGRVEIESSPDGAKVWMNGDLKGETPLQLQAISPGQYYLRIEEDGYAPVTQEILIERGRVNRVTVQLQKLDMQLNGSANLQELAAASFQQGDFLEASRKCDSILKQNSQDAPALELKEKIRVHLLEQGRQALRKGKWEVARRALEDALKVSPQDPEALRQLQKIKTKPDKKREVSGGEADSKGRIEDLQKRIELAVNSGNYLPPAPGNAIEMIRQLQSLSETDTFTKERMETILRDLLSQTQRKIQAKDLVDAKTLLRNLQMHFPESSEVRTLQDKLKVEEVKHWDALNSLVLRAESALTSGRYVTPTSENVLLFCNRALAMDPSNQKALNLKKESLAKAATQVREFVQSEKFEEAQEVLSALLHLSQFESRFPFTAQDLKAEMQRIEFSAYPVLHDHAFGNCTGRLRLNSYVLAFVPSSESKDGFSARLKEITADEPGDKLKIQIRSKTYRFQPNFGKNKEENREKVRAIYQELRRLSLQER